MGFISGISRTIVTYGRKGARVALDPHGFGNIKTIDDGSASIPERPFSAKSFSVEETLMRMARKFVTPLSSRKSAADKAAPMSPMTPVRRSPAAAAAEEDAAPIAPLVGSDSVADADRDVSTPAPCDDEQQDIIETPSKLLIALDLQSPATERGVQAAPIPELEALIGRLMTPAASRKSMAPKPKKQASSRTDLSLDDLLELCEQPSVPTMDQLIGKRCLKTCRKIGESTFAEVFKASYERRDVAIKIIPFGGSQAINGSDQTPLRDIYQEMRITLLLSKRASDAPKAASVSSIVEQDDTAQMGREIQNSFIEALRVGVCRGPYSPKLLQEWDDYADRKESENDRPGAREKHKKRISDMKK